MAHFTGTGPTALDESSLRRLVGRERPLFDHDLDEHRAALDEAIQGRRFLVVGGAGSIGSAVVRALFARSPRALHVVDIGENTLAEVVRSVRSELGYIDGDFRTFCVDILGPEFEALLHWAKAEGGYDAVLNFSALKHVRSERDPYTLMRMIAVNVLGTRRCIEAAERTGASRIFCVSTDKAANPANLMGATKRVMEYVLTAASRRIDVSGARFANVLFSDGSLPYSWLRRLEQGQPLVAPRDIQRYFVTPQEAATLCLFSTIQAGNREIFFPKLAPSQLTSFGELLLHFLEAKGVEAIHCSSEEEARARARDETRGDGKWPIYLFDTDTAGEKPTEEFFVEGEPLDLHRYQKIGVVEGVHERSERTLESFFYRLASLREAGSWSSDDLESLLQELSPFDHVTATRNLDQKM